MLAQWNGRLCLPDMIKFSAGRRGRRTNFITFAFERTQALAQRKIDNKNNVDYLSGRKEGEEKMDFVEVYLNSERQEIMKPLTDANSFISIQLYHYLVSD